MELLRTSSDFDAASKRPSIALGNFDGVHIGHQAIIGAALRDAAARSAPAVAFTFEPHPGAVVGRGEPPRLMTPEEKQRYIGDLGPDYLVVEPFDKDYASQSPREFVQRILVDRLGVGAVFVGGDFGFGKARAGNVDVLTGLGGELGFAVTAVGAVEVDGARVSSSEIRKLIGEGHVREAARRLSRPYGVGGKVVHGHARGAELGIRTANLEPEKFLLPARGVYVCRVEVEDLWVDAVANVGVKPTFGGENLTIEAHLLDFERDLYEHHITIAFIARLRDERRFERPEDLVAQIRRDIEQARQILSTH